MNRCIVGDNRDVLPTLEAGSVQTCVTSPPYFGLRDYGTGKWEGGDADCDHATAKIKGRADYGFSEASEAQRSNTSAGYSAFKPECQCGAKRIDNQIGLEQTPDAYVAELVKVFREVKRVLRDDGTLWLNLGDSYAGGGGHSPNAPSSAYSKSGLYGDALKEGGIKPQGVIKAKDLIGIPWRVAFALQADGWYLRQDIIWHKPNPMPESVTDRCTKAHEYIFLLSKSARYYFDAAAIAEEAQDWGTRDRSNGKYHNEGSGLTPHSGLEKSYETRNKRSVWTVTTKPFTGAHFATFPPDLIEPCILAGSKPGDTVLDPFGGSGTVGQVCESLGRKWLLIELNPAYADIAKDRTAQTGMVFA